MLVNSQLVCLSPVGILNLVCIGPEKPRWGVANYVYIYIYFLKSLMSSNKGSHDHNFDWQNFLTILFLAVFSLVLVAIKKIDRV